MEFLNQRERYRCLYVNALGYEQSSQLPEGKDVSAIDVDMMIEAKERLILRRETHLDQLADKLREDRVRRVIVPILSGDANPETIPTDDIQYVQDLGLIFTQGQIAIANRIYREIIPRELIYSTQLTIAQQSERYIRSEDGRLDMGKLIVWPYKNGSNQQIVLELKIQRRSRQKMIAEGLEQTWKYMDRCGTAEGHLLIFDRDEQKSWGDKIFCRTETYHGTGITVWGM